LNSYEAVYILSPSLSEEQLAATKADLRSKIEAVSGKDIVELRSERRTLTFPIKKQNEGFFVIFRYDGPADSVGKLRVELKHTEQILRMSYIRIPEKSAAVTTAAAPIPESSPAPMPEVPVAAPVVEEAKTDAPATA
jgi:small subunit ribosomal protein S6